jgi:hypothetical protein
VHEIEHHGEVVPSDVVGAVAATPRVRFRLTHCPTYPGMRRLPMSSATHAPLSFTVRTWLS